MTVSNRRKRAKRKAKENNLYRNGNNGIIHSGKSYGMPTCINVMNPTAMFGLSLISRQG